MPIFQMFMRALVGSIAYSVAKKIVSPDGGIKKSLFESWKVSRCPECLGLYKYIEICPLCDAPLDREYGSKYDQDYRKEDHNKDWQRGDRYDRS